MIDNSQTDTRTSHDPLCRWRVMKDLETCLTCISIAEARKEMLAKCIEAVETCGNDKGYIYSDTMTGVVWALDALRALSANADSDRNVSKRRQEKE